MSVASATAKVVFLQKSGTYTAMLTCDWGDIFQFYQVSGSTVTYSPDFSTASSKPTIEFLWSSSRTSATLTVMSVRWYLDNVQLLFTAGSQYYNLFTQVSPTKIRLVGNPGFYTGNTSCTLKAVATLSTGEELTASYNIPVTEGADSVYRAMICSGATTKYPNHFVITSKDPTDPGYKCILAAKCFNGMNDISSDVYYKWYKMNLTAQSGWQTIGVSTTVTVTEPDVATWGQYKVEAYDNSACTGDPLAQDVQEVLDYSDDLAIEVAYNPADATIVEGDSARDHVTITPKVVCVDTGATPSQYTNENFRFAVMDAQGNILNVGAAAAKTCNVTLAMAQQAGGDVRIIIETVS